MKYSKKFERDYKFYIDNLSRFSFCGKADDEFFDRNGNILVIYDRDGASAKYAFYLYESNGEIVKTFDEKLLLSLHKAKASINLHIKMWSDGRIDGTLPKVEFEEYCNSIFMPKWVLKAVESNAQPVMRKIYQNRLLHALRRKNEAEEIT